MTHEPGMHGTLVVESGHYINVTDIRFAPAGGTMVSASADETLRLWDLRMACEAGIFRGHRGPVYLARFDASGELLASAGWDHDVRIWDVATQQTRQVLRGISRHPVGALAFSSDGILAAATGTGVQDTPRQLLVWRVGADTPVHQLDVPGHVRGRSTALAFDPTAARLLYADADDRLHSLDIATGADDVLFRAPDVDVDEPVEPEEHGIVPEPPPGIAALLVLDDHRVLVLCRDVPRLLDLGSGAVVTTLDTANRPYGCDLLDDGTVALFGQGVEVWQVGPSSASRIEVVDIPAQAMSGDGALLAGADGRHVQLFDRVTASPIRRLGSRLAVPTQPGNMHRQFVLTTSARAPVVVHGGPDGYVRLWDLHRSVGPRSFRAHDGAVDAVAVSPDGRLLATGRQALRMWSVDDGTAIWHRTIEGGVKRLAFSADGSAIVAGGWSAGLQAFESQRGTPLEAAPSEGSVDALAVSPWNDILAVTFNALRTWAPFLADGPTAQGLPVASSDIAVSCTGWLALGLGYPKWFTFSNVQDPGVVLLVDPSGEPTALSGHESSVRTVAFSHDGTMLVSGAEDGKLIIWSTYGKLALAEVAAHAGDVTGLGFTCDDRFIASIGLDGAIRLWDDRAQLAATLLSLDDDDYVVVTDENHYSATREGLRAVKLRVDDRLAAFEEFDLEANRPDLVLRRLGYAADDLVASYADMHARRLDRLGVRQPPAGAHGPTLRVVDAPGSVAHQATVTLRVEVAPGDHPLDHLVVSANDVPVDGRPGRPIGNGSTLDVEVELAVGDNELQLWLVDGEGLRSVRYNHRIFRPDPGVDRTLYVLTVGVSAYRDRRLSLDYAAKDARDLAAELRSIQRRFARVEDHVLEDASLDDIVDAREFLRRGGVDDQAVVFFAGHGVLEDGEFFFLPADFDPDDLPSTAVSYGQLEMLFDGIGPRRRLLLIDACHSGEPEGDEPGSDALPVGVRSVRSFRDARPVSGPRPQPVRTVRLVPRLQEVFADLRQESGTYVLAAAGAAEYAFERDELQNGVFTACVLRALRAAGPEGIRVSGLARVVADQVSELTAGGQRPVSRRENLADDFVVA
jgi:WD40 repeat protein